MVLPDRFVYIHTIQSGRAEARMTNDMIHTSAQLDEAYYLMGTPGSPDTACFLVGTEQLTATNSFFLLPCRHAYFNDDEQESYKAVIEKSRCPICKIPTQFICTGVRIPPANAATDETQVKVIWDLEELLDILIVFINETARLVASQLQHKDFDKIRNVLTQEIQNPITRINLEITSLRKRLDQVKNA
jgi:hypothetical protein